MKTLLIIPAYNEEENIEAVVDNLIINYPQYDYVVINDCSTDSTADICRKRGYNFIDLPFNLGIGGGVQTGFQYALKNGYDCAVQLDGDGQHDPAYIADIIKPIEDGEADVAIGSRFISHEGFQSSGARRAGIKLLSFLIKLFGGSKVKDVTSGFRAVNRKFIKIYANDYADDYPEPEAVVAAKMYAGKTVEIPVKMCSRAGGVSSISPLKSVYYMIKVSISILIYRITFKGGKK